MALIAELMVDAPFPILSFLAVLVVGKWAGSTDTTSLWSGIRGGAEWKGRNQALLELKDLGNHEVFHPNENSAKMTKGFY